MQRPLVPSDLWTPSEALIHALGRAACAAAHGDADAVRTLRLVFGTELLKPKSMHSGVADDRSAPAQQGRTRRQGTPSA